MDTADSDSVVSYRHRGVKISSFTDARGVRLRCNNDTAESTMMHAIFYRCCFLQKLSTLFFHDYNSFGHLIHGSNHIYEKVKGF